MADLPDVNVWISLSVPEHPHHARAAHYWRREAAAERVVCRASSMGLLRLLTDQRTFEDSALSAAGAWLALDGFLAQPGVRFAAEPAGIDDVLRHVGTAHSISGADWSDAYLAAFAMAADLRLVSFDRGFDRFSGLSWLHLEP